MRRLSCHLNRLLACLSRAWWAGMTRYARESLRDDVEAMERWRDRRH